MSIARAGSSNGVGFGRAHAAGGGTCTVAVVRAYSHSHSHSDSSITTPDSAAKKDILRSALHELDSVSPVPVLKTFMRRDASFSPSPFAKPSTANRTALHSDSALALALFPSSASTMASTSAARAGVDKRPDSSGPRVFLSVDPCTEIPMQSSMSSSATSVAPQDSLYFVNERRAVISACLASGDCKRAETVFNRSVFMLRMGEQAAIDAGVSFKMPALIERGMVNAFVEAYLTQSPPNFEKAEFWHHRAKEHGLPADSSTYAALVHHSLITENNLGKSAKIVLEMKNNGLDPALLFGERSFTELEDCAALSALIRSMQGLKVDLQSVEDQKVVSDIIVESAKALDQTNQREVAGSQTAVFPKRKGDSLMLSAISETTDTTTAAKAENVSSMKLSDLVRTNSIGVKILQKTLASLSLDAASVTDKIKLQSELEEKAFSAAVEEMTLSKETLPESLRSIIQMPGRYMATWNRLLIPEIKSQLESMEIALADSDQNGSLPFLKLLTPEQLAKITITEFLRVSADPDQVLDVSSTNQIVPTVSLLARIGTAIEMEHNLQQINKKKNKKMVSLLYSVMPVNILKLETQMGIHNLHINGRLFNQTMRKVITKLAQSEAAANEKGNWIPKWPSSVKIRAGSVLAVLMLKIAKVQVPHPNPEDPSRDIIMEENAFHHSYVFNKNKRVGVIQMHPFILEQVASNPVHLHPRLLPMIVPPRPWVTRTSGGYLHHKSEVLRTISREHLAYLAAADERQHLNGVFESLDVLGKTAWRINERVYEIVKTVWNSGEAIADLPPIPAVREKRKPKPENWDNMEGKEKRAWVQQAQKEELDRRNDFSQRCDTNYKIEIARSFIGQTIYFPHNLDFRGRAYPMPAHLNHMGNDLCRGLLLFDSKKPLGERGFKWLKVQAANLMGNNKISFDERAQFVEDHIDDVLDSADNPLTGKRWWLTAEDPWQMLATCFELADAYRSSDPSKFMSCLPVHQDGTCNGLQHYAALGGDSLGAAQVNLIPSKKPGDIYSGVAERVSALVDKRAAEGSEACKRMQGKITRKLVKQTVMTNTYGVTFVGARAQVTARMKENKELYAFTDEEIKESSLEITHLIFDSLGELFSGARALQNWLNSTASLIAKSVPASAIPEIQLIDAEFLNSIGCLPSPFTVARAEMKNTKSQERVVSDSVPEVLDLDDQLINAALEDHTDAAAEVRLFDFFDDELGSDAGKIEEMKSAAEEAQAAIDAVNSADISKASEDSKKKVEKMASVIWTTPLGLPIVQPYRVMKTKVVQTMLQTVTVSDNMSPTPVNAMKQSTAFPPNFIHSLDATHMMLSAIACNQHHIEFAAVHDSYWTHAADVDSMAAVLRETFVTLHSKEIMQNLRQELQDRNSSHKCCVTVELTDPNHLQLWADHLKKTGRRSPKAKGNLRKGKVSTWVDLVIPPLPAKGDFDVRIVRDSPYFFH
ncbi:DNA-directed RNA polymerase [Entophlyctis sp. JEL0112]|nr:DNA-directed RNA polymerase [Entophlyctis sp. JEL0112]